MSEENKNMTQPQKQPEPAKGESKKQAPDRCFWISCETESIHKIAGKMFMPGLNEITRKEWEAIKKHKVFAAVEREGFLNFVGPSPDDEEAAAPHAPHPFDGMKEREAIKHIQGTVTETLLVKWKAHVSEWPEKEERQIERKRRIMDALIKQIARLQISEDEIKKDAK